MIMFKTRTINTIILHWILTSPIDPTLEIAESTTEQPEEKIDFAVGGQAVIEGVMMRSPRHITIAVRKQNGSIKVKKDHYLSVIQKYKFLNVPIVRGVINLFEMMIIGTKAINYSANESLDMEEEVKDEKKSKTRLFFEGLMFIVSLIIALGFSLILFKFIPLLITTFLDENIAAIHNNYLLFNMVDALIKGTIFLTYVYLLSLIPSFRRVFEYHGSEHKSIITYENKLPLTVENAKKQTRFHPRCGTSFIIIVFIISIFVYSLLPKQDEFIQNFLLRLSFLPLVAGISYEALKLSAKHSEKAFVKMLIAPGLAFQKLTTKEPKNDQLEVGLDSLKAALVLEKVKF